MFFFFFVKQPSPNFSNVIFFYQQILYHLQNVNENTFVLTKSKTCVLAIDICVKTVDSSPLFNNWYSLLWLSQDVILNKYLQTGNLQ